MDSMLLKLAQAVTEAHSLEDLARPLLEMLESVTGFESVYLTTIEAEAGRQQVLFARNARRLHIPEGLSVPWKDTLCRRALEQGVTGTDDVPGLWPDSAAARALGLVSYASVPVHAGDELYGTLCAASVERRQLHADAQRLLQMFARLIGQQVERDTLLAHLRQRNLDLSTAAHTDPLTGIANRRALIAELVRMLARSAREHVPLHVAFIDLDGFKAINDRHGHDAGDAFLAAVAARLVAAVRSGDFVARYGGDEFVVLALAPDPVAVDGLVTRLSAALPGRYELGRTTIDYGGASLGHTAARAGEHADEILARADAAMYEEKRRRRAASV
jgi:diguanylate cyclase